MKSKQVAALLLAAALTVTGSGVTTMAGQFSAGNEAVVIDSDSILKMGYNNDTKLFQTLTVTDPVAKSFKYGEKVTVTAVLTKQAAATFEAGGEPVLEIVTGTSTTDKNAKAVEGTSVKAEFKDNVATHTLTFVPEKGKNYFVRASAVELGAASYVRVFKSMAITLEAADEILKSSDIPSPDFSKAVVIKDPDTLTFDANKTNIKFEEINEDPAVKGKGSWNLKLNGNTKSFELGKEYDLELTFTAEDGYKFEAAGEDELEGDGTGFHRTVKVTPIFLTKNVTVKKKGTSDTSATLLKTSAVEKPSVILQADFGTGGSAKVTDPDAVIWELGDGAAEYLTMKDNKDGTATFIATGKETPESGVKVKATANEAEFAKLVEKEEGPASGEFTIHIKKGVTAADVEKAFQDICDKEVTDFTYAGKETWSDHYDALLAKLKDENINPLAALGDYTLVTPTGTTLVAAQDVAYDVKFKYTANKDSIPAEERDDTKKWTSAGNNRTIEKSYKVKVSKATKDASGLQKELGIKDAYTIGTGLKDIFDTTAPANKNHAIYDFTWQEYKGDRWETVSDAAIPTTKITKTGSFPADKYLLAVSLDTTMKGNYDLSGAGEDGTLILPLENVKIVAPDFTPEAAPKDKKAGEKYVSDSDTSIALEVDEDKIKEQLGGAKDYYTLSYQWYKDGKFLNANASGANTMTTVTNKILTISNWTPEAAGSYTCEVTATLIGGGTSVEELSNSAQYKQIVKTTGAVKVETSRIQFSDETSALEITYGDEKTDQEISVKATLDGIDSYRIFYRKLDEKENEGAEVEVAEKNIDEFGKVNFQSGSTITYNLKDAKLPAGTYNFYVSVKAGTDTNTSKAIPVTVKAAAVAAEGLSKEKLSAEALTYGQTLADVKLSYSGEEKDKLDFTLKDDLKTVLPAGEHTLKVAVAAKENYALDQETELSVTLTVNKATLTVKAADLSIKEGDQAAKLTAKVSGIAESDKEEEIIKVTPYVEADGKEVTDLSTLAAGTYKIFVKAELTEKALSNYEYDKESEKEKFALLTVEKAAAQDPGTNNTPGNGNQGGSNTPGTQDPGTNTPGTQNPGTNTPDTNTPGTQNPGTNTPGTEEKVTAKKVDITLNGQSLSGTVKAKTKTTYKLKAAVTLSNGKKASNVTWSTSNKKIATVSKSGVVKVQNKTGKVKITAKYSDGNASEAKTITLNVAKANVKAASLKITGKKSMKVKKSQTLKVTVSPATVTNGKVTWKTSNKKIATVSSKGVVKALKKGKVTITATAKDGSKKKASFKITVK